MDSSLSISINNKKLINKEKEDYLFCFARVCKIKSWDITSS